MAWIIRYIIYWCSYKQIINKRNKNKTNNAKKTENYTNWKTTNVSFIANKFSIPSPGFCCLPFLGLSDTLAFIYNPISLRWNAFVTGSWSSASHRIDNLWPHKNHKAARVETLWRCWLKIETGQGTRQCCPYTPFYNPLSFRRETTFDLHVLCNGSHQLSADISRLFGYG